VGLDTSVTGFTLIGCELNGTLWPCHTDTNHNRYIQTISVETWIIFLIIQILCVIWVWTWD